MILLKTSIVFTYDKGNNTISVSEIEKVDGTYSSKYVTRFDNIPEKVMSDFVQSLWRFKDKTLGNLEDKMAESQLNPKADSKFDNTPSTTFDFCKESNIKCEDCKKEISSDDCLSPSDVISNIDEAYDTLLNMLNDVLTPWAENLAELNERCGNGKDKEGKRRSFN